MSVDTKADVQALFEKALALSHDASPLTSNHYRSDIQDHFYYVGAVCPQHFYPLQSEAINLPCKQLSFLNFSFPTWLYLLQGASDTCVDDLLKRLYHTNPDCHPYLLETMLAAIGTETACVAIAEYVQRTQRQKLFSDLGFWLPGKGKKAEPRFTWHRSAVRFLPTNSDISPDALARWRHPVGLPVSAIAQKSAQDIIAWHYLTLDLAQVADFPSVQFSYVHLVSPLRISGWTLFCAISEQSLYTQAISDMSEEEDFNTLARLKAQAIEGRNDRQGEVILLPYDDQLVYRNGHTLLTEDVYGDVGGPPLGLDGNPCCPICRKLMFHVCTVTNTLREYGDGFRSLFICENCMQVASQAIGWN